MSSNLIELECSACAKKYDASREQHLCTCGKPLLARYDLKRAAGTFTLETLKDRPRNLWRYAEVLPDDPPVSLGEGMTPLVHAKRLGASLGLANLYVKDEGLNPTGSFKARGMSAAVTRARQLGVKALAAPTAGNAGGALAAYAAAAGMAAVIVMPADTPSANVMECQAFGAKVVKLNGLISDCGKYVAENKDREGWYDVSTLKEPYRVEGKKTMGYELWEQFGGKLPHVIFYPTGGGVGLIGMCKAFDELQQMGRIGGERPRMVAVQAEGCAPIVKAWEAHQSSAQFFPNAATIASGLRVPWPLGDQLILSMLRQTRGTAVSVTDNEMLHGGRELASLEGILAAPEGAATVVAARILAGSGWIKPHETVVLFNTGTGYKYSEAWQKALQA
ncbi:MAG: threonine synthase [Acidobacteria bacterium]|nr:MAG: threonine synthase [Acidobacteria bacterium 13_2_20CM_58_27]PYT72204.1 MAG: threonine synthase [Acidobacteriota bacterium]PYT85270.1 MAG: threonine synthase [Acidobacteriota bacterium]